MAKYLISFPSSAMNLTGEELADAARDAHAVVREAKAAGVWVFGGGIDESVPPVMVTGSGSVLETTYEQTRHIEGGYSVLELETREEALEWARRTAVACRCAQEVRVFMDDPES
ncbi:YciI family protein [Brachybacterium saurashtrense]|uniref:Transcription initiation protein n=1 Tax=Brachybacterium saurashtrense TaxID=556288 RepID=A0A345YML8_9MICO|nr:YciI family protein [Brachybacterium saurashtrense]AXK45170.1 transcription initiation protein [Brachybacterium saurashtrense]RRR22076.1 transcription initiation protein [Brachybacterium saurashtrense]